MTRVAIDPNVRARGNLTFAGFEDVEGDFPSIGDRVQVFEPESGLAGEGDVSDIDNASHLIYLQIEWASLRFPVPLEELEWMHLNPRSFTTGGNAFRSDGSQLVQAAGMVNGVHLADAHR